MAAIVKSVDLAATFSQMGVGESVKIGLSEVSEGNVRVAAVRFSKSGEKRLRVSILKAEGVTRVTRIA